ncbi:Fic family protein [Leptospira meyeri]|uniref:Fic family protein n=1 Tax=Leptospira meyeri TaxID=29508 RepID=UPI0002BE0DC7|nr:Fic family protein [Leptospira meyeri]EMJ88175.1 Fic/DOC family protein [Leptospira meyeri serovar Semaranga str. Veldrot Semarang 173]
MNRALYLTEKTTGITYFYSETEKRILENKFELFCRTPILRDLSEWRINVSSKNQTLSLFIKEKIVRLSESNNFDSFLNVIEKNQPENFTKQYLNIINVLKQLPNINLIENLILPFHSKIHSGGPIRDLGEYRKQNVWFIEPTADDFNKKRLSPPPFESITTLMEIWERMFHEKTINPILDSTLLYIIFQSIHPLENDNGKFGWILLIIFLMKQNLYFDNLLLYPSIILENKKQFYLLLENAINHNDLDSLISFLLENFMILIEEKSDYTYKFKGKIF